MKKRVIIVLSSLVVFVLAITCAIVFIPNYAEPIDLAEDITMEIKEGTLTKTGATIVITDLSGKNNTFSKEFRIDQKRGGKWYTLKDKSKNKVNVVAGQKEENKKLEQELNWEKNYGTLSDGYYRIVKKINNKDIVVEFEIESLK